MHQIKGLQVIINTCPAPAFPLVELAQMVITGGADCLQFRHKGPYTRDVFAAALQISELCTCRNVPFIIDDRFDIAAAVGASGVHLGQNDADILVARKFLGQDKVIGATASSLEQAKAAESKGADYIGLGHIFPTKTKVKNTPPLGVMALKNIRSQMKIPVLAIGGINEWNLTEVCSSGADGVAIISAICASLEPQNQTIKFKNILKKYGTS